jgi:hypothetical protein
MVATLEDKYVKATAAEAEASVAIIVLEPLASVSTARGYPFLAR